MIMIMVLFDLGVPVPIYESVYPIKSSNRFKYRILEILKQKISQVSSILHSCRHSNFSN